MNRFLLPLCLAILLAGHASVFSQARRGQPEEAPKKANQREVKPTPTPSPSPGTGAVGKENETVDPTAVADDPDVITVETDLVTIPVKVLDRNNRFIAGLTKENFKVLEDNIEQEIAYFSNEQEPFTVALVLDMSYSAKFKAEEIQSAALSFINQLRPADRVMVVSFDEEVYVNCEPTSDRQVIQRAIRGTKISYGTSLYDAMDLVINGRFRKINGRKAIVLFSDGVDTTSKKAHEMKNLIDALELDAMIYPIRYDTFQEVQAMKNKPIVNTPKQPSPIPSGQKNPFPFPFPTGGGVGVGTPDSKGTTAAEYAKADEYLNELSNRTGGRLYQASTISNLSNAFSNIASELREFYSLGFISNQSLESGKRHKIKVRTDRQGVAVKARDSYVARSRK